MAQVQSKFITSTSNGVTAPLGYTLQADGSGNATWQPSGSGGVPAYTNFASFPSASSVGNGALAIALDTNILYESNGTSWIVLAPYTGSSAFVAFASSPITGSSANVTSVVPTFTTFSNSPGFQFTPNITGTYKVYAALPLLPSGNNIASYGKIFNTSGGATLLQESWAIADGFKSGVTDPLFSSMAQSTYVLTAGVNYQFDIQGSNDSGGTVTLYPISSQFYMFAEGISLNGAMKNNGSSFDIYASSQVSSDSYVTTTSYSTFSNSPAFTFTPTISGTYKVYSTLPLGANILYVASARIFNTTGGAILSEEQEASVQTNLAAPFSSVTTFSIYELTAGTTYQFDIQGKTNNASGESVLYGASGNPFYMFAEGIGLTNSNQQFPVNFKATGSGAWTGGSPIALPTVVYDTNSAYNPSTGQYTVPYSGYYLVGWNGNAAGGNKQVSIYINGVFQELIDNGYTSDPNAAGLISTFKLNKNDIVTWIPSSSFSTNQTIQWISSTTLTSNLMGPNGSSTGSAFAYFTSSIVNTLGSGVGSSLFTTFDNSPAFTFTPTISGIYKVYSSVPLNMSGVNNGANCRIFNTSGGATLLQESWGANYFTGGSADVKTVLAQSVYSLTAGTMYIFDIQGNVYPGGTAYADGRANIGGQFYMFAEGIGLTGAFSEAITPWNQDLTFTPSSGFGTPTNSEIYSRVVGDSLEVEGSFIVGTTTATVMSISLPTGYAIDYSKINTLANADQLGIWTSSVSSLAIFNQASNQAGGVIYADGSDTANVYIAGQAVSNQYWKQPGNDIFVSGNQFSFQCSIPIVGLFGSGNTGVSRIIKSNSTGVFPFSNTQVPILDSGGVNPITVTVNCNGGDVEIGLMSDGTNQGSDSGVIYTDSTPADSYCTISYYRDGTFIGANTMYMQNNISIEIHGIPSSSFRYIDTPTPGNHTYTVQILGGVNRSDQEVDYTILYARPMA
jgi:hypothetical protein